MHGNQEVIQFVFFEDRSENGFPILSLAATQTTVDGLSAETEAIAVVGEPAKEIRADVLALFKSATHRAQLRQQERRAA